MDEKSSIYTDFCLIFDSTDHTVHSTMDLPSTENPFSEDKTFIFKQKSIHLSLNGRVYIYSEIFLKHLFFFTLYLDLQRTYDGAGLH